MLEVLFILDYTVEKYEIRQNARVTSKLAQLFSYLKSFL